MPELPHRPFGFELGQPWMARYGEEEQFKSIATRRLAQHNDPTIDNWLGTDGSGRDNWSRIVWGARRSLFLAVWALGIATAVGTFIGVITRLLPRVARYGWPTLHGCPAIVPAAA